MAEATTSAQGRVLVLRPNASPQQRDALAGASAASSLLPAKVIQEDEDSFKPRLAGNRMPVLDWPDSRSGPWSTASTPRRLEHEERSRAIKRWFEQDEESDEERTPTGMQQDTFARHPMIAKVIMDRRRKELLLHSFAITTPCSTTISSDSGGSAFSSRKTKRRKNRTKDGSHDIESPSCHRQKIRKQRIGKKLLSSKEYLQLTTPRKKKSKTMANVAVTAKGSALPAAAQIGCQCGHGEEIAAAMIQCDGCNVWYHMSCVGIKDPDGSLEANWYCIMCCDVSTTILTPSSSGLSSSGLSVTPIFPRSAVLAGQQVRLSQGQLPVFAQPTETPSHRHREEGHSHPFSSALALAPSPIVPSSRESTIRRPTGQQHIGGRARASRVGWHAAEPGSPLERKSLATAFSSSHKRALSGSAGMFSPIPRHADRGSLAYGAHDSSDSQHAAAAAMSADVYLRTPSPRIPSSTASRTRQESMRSAGHSNGSVNGHRREPSGALRDFDDVFSTPSRILSGSASWGQPSTSMMRHSRQESGGHIGSTANGVIGSGVSASSGPHGTPWGLSTPTRHLMDAGFQSDYSGGAAGGLPSLVHSSGGLDMGDFTGWHHLQMSPTSSTRGAARARQQSGAVAFERRRTWSARQPATPDRASGSSFDALSSSPFPKTPTFTSDMYRHHSDDEDDDERFAHEMGSPSFAGRGSAISHHLSASRHLGNFSHRVGHSPKASSGSPNMQSHVRTFGAPSKSHNGSYGSVIGNGEVTAVLQGPAEIKSRMANAVTSTVSSQGAAAAKAQAALPHGTKARARNASNDLMAGLGIGLDLNDVIEWV